MEPLYYGYFGTSILVLNTEVSSIQRSFTTLQYYTGTQNGVLIIDFSAIQRFVIVRLNCIYLKLHKLAVGDIYTYLRMYVHMYICMDVLT